MHRFAAFLWRALLLLVLALILAFAYLAVEVDLLGRRDDARPSDVIVVLGARVTPDGQPGSDLTSRTFHAVDLWNAGIAPNLVCTGGYKDEPLSAAAVCKRFATELGVPASAIYLADGSSNTIEDAQATAQVMAAHGWHSAVLVSHPLHLYRSRWLFRRAGINAVTSPTSTDTSRIFPLLRVWYASREAFAVSMTALHGWDVIPREWVAKLQTWTYGLQ